MSSDLTSLCVSEMDAARFMSLSPGSPVLSFDESPAYPILPFDVVAHIMARSTPSTISAFMQTCHAYYREGPKHLLRDGVTFDCERQLTLFIPFIRAEEGARFAYFRELNIASDFELVPYPGSVATGHAFETLAELIGDPMCSLERLTLGDASSFLKYDHFIGALRTSKSVKALRLQDSGPETCRALRTLQFGLVSLTISFDKFADLFDEEDLQLEHPPVNLWQYLLYMISPHAQSLENFRCNALPQNRPLQLPVSATPTCFPTTTTLGLVCDLRPRGQIDVASLSSTFPNVTCLELLAPSPHHLSPFDQLRIARENNQRILESHGCWAALQKCSGDLSSLYISGLGTRVDDLCIWGSVEGREALKMLVAILGAMRPCILRLNVEGLDTLSDIASALRASEGDVLRTLHIIVTFDDLRARNHVLSSKSLNDAVVAALLPLPRQLVTLELFIEMGHFDAPRLNADKDFLEELRSELMKHATSTLRHVVVRRADWYRLEPPDGLIQKSDDGYSGQDYDDADDYWNSDRWDVYDSDDESVY